MKRKTIRKGDDFKAVITFDNRKDGSVVDVETMRFRFVYSDGWGNEYEVSYDGVDRLNCYIIESGELVAVFDNPPFGLGMIKRAEYYNEADSLFCDGEWNHGRTVDTMIEITRDGGVREVTETVELTEGICVNESILIAKGDKGDKGIKGDDGVIVISNIRMTHKGVYNPTQTYDLLDVVTYQDSSYSSNSNDNSTVPTSSLWGLVAKKGKDGVDGKSAYDIAVSDGYGGTLEEFGQELARVDSTLTSLPQTLTSAQKVQVHTNIDADAIAESWFIKRMLFFTSPLGTSYDKATKLFTIGDINDLTMDDMLVISEYGMNKSLDDLAFVRSYSTSKLFLPRIILPLRYIAGMSPSIRLVHLRELEIVYAALKDIHINLDPSAKDAPITVQIYGALKLTKIVGIITVSHAKTISILACPLLEEIYIRKLNTNATIGTTKTPVPNITKKCYVYMLTNRANPFNKVIILSVDEQTYKWMSGDSQIQSLLPLGTYNGKDEVGEVELAAS